jgi:hypothetical protein
MYVGAGAEEVSGAEASPQAWDAMELSTGHRLPSPESLSHLVACQQWTLLDELLPPHSTLVPHAVSPLVAQLAAVASSVGPVSSTDFCCNSPQGAAAEEEGAPSVAPRLSLFGSLCYARCRQAALTHRGKLALAVDEAASCLGFTVELLEAVQPHGSEKGGTIISTGEIVSAPELASLVVVVAWGAISYAEALRGASAWRESSALLYATMQWAANAISQAPNTGASKTIVGQAELTRALGGLSPGDGSLPIGARALIALAKRGRGDVSPDTASCIYAAAALQCSRVLGSAGLALAAAALLQEADSVLHSWCTSPQGKPDAPPAPSAAFISGVSGLPAAEVLGQVPATSSARELALVVIAQLWRQCSADYLCADDAASAARCFERLAALPGWPAVEALADAWLASGAGTIAAPEATSAAPTFAQSYLASQLLMLRGDMLVSRSQLESAQNCYEIATAASLHLFSTATALPLFVPATPPPEPAFAALSRAPPSLPPTLPFQTVLPSLADLVAAACMSVTAPLARQGGSTLRSAHHQAATLLLDALVRSAPGCFGGRHDVIGVLCALYEASLDAASAARSKRVLQAVATRLSHSHLPPSAFLLMT